MERRKSVRRGEKTEDELIELCARYHGVMRNHYECLVLPLFDGQAKVRACVLLDRLTLLQETESELRASIKRAVEGLLGRPVRFLPGESGRWDDIGQAPRLSTREGGDALYEIGWSMRRCADAFLEAEYGIYSILEGWWDHLLTAEVAWTRLHVLDTWMRNTSPRSVAALRGRIDARRRGLVVLPGLVAW